MRDFADKIFWVVVADGQKALWLRNEDTASHPLLGVMELQEIENPPSREQGSGKPGRMNDGAGGARRSSFQEADWHAMEKDKFAHHIADRLNQAALKNAFDGALIFAPPSTLGEMRQHYHATLKERLAGEIAADLTKQPVEYIEKRVAEALSGK